MTTSTKKRPALYSRKKRLKQSQRLADCHAVVIGAGTLGRTVAILLASLGIKRLLIYDPAFVSKKDLTCGFMDGDEGLARVDAVANIAHQHNPGMELLAYRCRFRRAHLQKWNPKLKHVVFLCMKSVAQRQSIWHRVTSSAQFLCQVSVVRNGISLRIATSPTIDRVASIQIPGVSRTYLFELVVTNIVAGGMILQLMRWLRC